MTQDDVNHILIVYIEEEDGDRPDAYEVEHPAACERRYDSTGMFATYHCGVDVLIAEYGLEAFIAWKDLPPGQYEIAYWYEEHPGEPDRFENGIHLIFRGEIIESADRVHEIIREIYREFEQSADVHNKLIMITNTGLI